VFDKASGSSYDNLLLFEDCADVGEGWNYIKPMIDKEYLSSASAAQVSVMCDSPDLIKLCITVEMAIPTAGTGITRSDKTSVMSIENVLTVYKNERSIIIKTKVDNKNTEHRLRAVFETGIKTDVFKTSLPFDITEWNIEKADNTYDKETDTFVNPNQGLISVSDGRRGIAVYNNGLYEAAVLNKDSAAVYLTLFRSFPNEVAQSTSIMGKMLFEMTFDYKLEFFSEISNSALMKNANEFKTGLDYVSVKSHGGKLSPAGSFIDITGSAILSGMRDIADGKCELRIYDLDGGSEGEITLFSPIKSAFESDFRHIRTADAVIVNGKLKYKLGSKQIKTFIIEV
jgi:alpha-mannosidase/mannosylglycerate hydrolase